MRKAIVYSGFALASLVVVATFLSARDYTQLGAAVILYPLLAYLAYELFVRKSSQETYIPVAEPAPVKEEKKVEVETVKVTKEGASIKDFDKRTFLKLIGAAGVSFFLYTILARRSDVFFGKAIQSGPIALEDASGKKIDPSEKHPTDGYRISEIDDSELTFYGFINKLGAWFIMKEDPDSGSFRYIKGDVDFSGNWSSRKRQKYDYYHNVFS